MKKIFLVDDDADDRMIFREALEEVTRDFECHTATNGAVALNMLYDKLIEIPDLIFLDVNMPYLNGWQCLTALKSEPAFKEIPVIMFSTSSQAEDIERATANGALCFFSKPDDFEDIKKSLKIVAGHLEAGTIGRLANNSPVFAGAIP